MVKNTINKTNEVNKLLSKQTKTKPVRKIINKATKI